jgi:hypothetical protein
VSLGEPVIAGRPLAAVSVTVEADEAVVVNQDYSDRPGYDPDFLQSIMVPLQTPHDGHYWTAFLQR